MTVSHLPNSIPAGNHNPDDAVGVSGSKWYVAIVNPRHEKKVASLLAKEGYNSYVASQEEMRLWRNGKRKLVDRVVISSMVFIKCTEKERRQIVTLPYILRFMVNRAAESGTLNKPVAVISEAEMEKLQFMLGQRDYPVNFIPTSYRRNDTVRVTRGSLKGLEGRISVNPDGSHSLMVNIPILGGAIVSIDPSDVEKTGD